MKVKKINVYRSIGENKLDKPENKKRKESVATKIANPTLQGTV